MIESSTMVECGDEVTAQRDELAQKLGADRPAKSRTRASVQILSGVLREAEAGGCISPRRTSLLRPRSSVAAQVDGEGSVVVPGRLLVDLAPASAGQRGDGSSTDRTRTWCTSPRARPPRHSTPSFRASHLDAVGITVERQSLDTLSAVASASLATSPGWCRRGSSSGSRRKLVMAATDSYRLSVKETELSGEVRSRGDDPARALASRAASRSPATTSSSACTRTRSSSLRTTCG